MWDLLKVSLLITPTNFQYFGKQIFVWSSVIKGASFDLQHGYNCFGFLPLYAIAKNFAVKMPKQDLT